MLNKPMTLPDQTVRSVREAYDAWHLVHEADPAASAPWYEMVKARSRPDQDLAGRRVLEIGCGLGGFSCWLARHPARPAEVVAADFSDTAVQKATALAATLGTDHVRFVVADILRLDQFEDGEFDTVFSCETIEHVPDPQAAVRQLARVLRPGGRLYLTTPNYLSSMGLYRIYCWARGRKFTECGQPLNQLTYLPKTRFWVARAGLRVVVTDSTGQYFLFPGRPPIRLGWLESPHILMRWFGHHSMVVGEKPFNVETLS
jgi:ubiquinone/menaquinone biosynthesis C-methylase UbiE